MKKISFEWILSIASLNIYKREVDKHHFEKNAFLLNKGNPINFNASKLKKSQWELIHIKNNNKNTINAKTIKS